MEIYNENDLKIIQNNIESIKASSLKKKEELLGTDKKIESTSEVNEIKQTGLTDIKCSQLSTMLDNNKQEEQEKKCKEGKIIEGIILQYIRDKHLKVYGGVALNMYIKEKNPSDAFYSDNDIHDVEFYSPDPIKDLLNLCNIFFDKGYKDVVGKEALHTETYKIRVNGTGYCDISYVPKNVYFRMPFKVINGLYLINTNFMTIDYLRMLNDPIISYWRLEKAVSRFYLLQKYYPLPHIEDKLYPPSNTHDKITEELMNETISFLKNKKSVIMLGFYTYNYLLEHSGILKSGKTYFSPIDLPYYEFLSSDYSTDADDLLKLLKSKHPDVADKIKFIEYYPFFQFYGYNGIITYNDIIIAKLYDHNKHCNPYMSAVTKTKSTIQVATFMLELGMCLILAMKARVDRNNDMSNLYYTMCSHLIEMRRYFFDSTKKTILDNTPFKDFVIDCTGKTMTPQKERELMKAERKKMGKRASFRYSPADGKQEQIRLVFANSSGNIIRNTKNLQVGEKKVVTEKDTEVKVKKE